MQCDVRQETIPSPSESQLKRKDNVQVSRSSLQDEESRTSILGFGTCCPLHTRRCGIHQRLLFVLLDRTQGTCGFHKDFLAGTSDQATERKAPKSDGWIEHLRYRRYVEATKESRADNKVCTLVLCSVCPLQVCQRTVRGATLFFFEKNH